MLFARAPLSAHASCFGASSPRCNTHRVLFRGKALAPAACREAIKNPTARLAVGDKVKDSAVPPRLTRHRCRVHSSTANTVRLLTRALRPRLLVTFRLGPPGPILSGSVSAGITPSPTLSQSVSRFLPVNGLLSCFYAITAFSPCQWILTRFLKFSARSSTNARRVRTRTRTTPAKQYHIPRLAPAYSKRPAPRHTQRTRNIPHFDTRDGLAISRPQTDSQCPSLRLAPTDSLIIDFLPHPPHHTRTAQIVYLRK